MILQMTLIVFHMIVLHDPSGKEIDVNIDSIVSIKEPPPKDALHFQRGVRCVIFTDDGKFTAVTESCDEVREEIHAKQIEDENEPGRK
jgi:hypothetical protein